MNYDDSSLAWNWVTYKAERDYITFTNTTDPAAELLGAGKLLTESQAQAGVNLEAESPYLAYTRVQVGCLRKRWKCAGYEVRGGGAVLLAAVSLDTLASLASAETGAATTRLKLEVGPMSCQCRARAGNEPSRNSHTLVCSGRITGRGTGWRVLTRMSWTGAAPPPTWGSGTRW